MAFLIYTMFALAAIGLARGLLVEWWDSLGKKEVSCQRWKECTDVASKACPSGYRTIKREIFFDDDKESSRQLLRYRCGK
jgi:hypothetical protein